MHFSSGRITIAALVMACSAAPSPAVQPVVAGPPSAAVISCVDLPRDDDRSHRLSGLAWDPVAQRLFALSDRDKQLTVLVPRPGFAGFDLLSAKPGTSAGQQIVLAIDARPWEWDAEALAIASDRFLVVANETHAAVFSVDRAGGDPQPVELPAFPRPRDNLGIEALGYVEADGHRYVLAINEEALEGDGPTSTDEHGTLVRILRHSLDRGAPDLEVAYQTDRIFTRTKGRQANNGVSDLVPLSPDRLLVLERGWVKGCGNSARIYDVDLRHAENVMAMRDARAATRVYKHLVVDLADIADDRCSKFPAPQRKRTLENWEGMALGPRLDDGRQLVFLVNDDNGNATQVPRVITLALAPGAL